MCWSLSVQINDTIVVCVHSRSQATTEKCCLLVLQKMNLQLFYFFVKKKKKSGPAGGARAPCAPPQLYSLSQYMFI